MRREYLEAIRRPYGKARKKNEKPILEEFYINCAYHRKYTIRPLGPCPSRRVNHPGARPFYDSKALLLVLKRIWFATDQMCSKKLTAALLLRLPHYEQEYGALPASVKTHCYQRPQHRSAIEAGTYAMSRAWAMRPQALARCSKNMISIRAEYWDIARPGFVEADTVGTAQYLGGRPCLEPDPHR